MNRAGRYRVLVYAVLLLQAQPLQAQEDAPQPVVENISRYRREAMSNEAWERLTRDPAFHYRHERENIKAPEKPKGEQQNWLTRMILNLVRFFTSGIGVLLFWLIIFAVLGYVLFRILKGDVGSLWGRKAKKAPVTADKDILTNDELRTADWQALMETALQQGDRRLATRFLFVHLLQLLYRQDYIQYRIDATNYEYYAAIRREDLKSLYRQLLIRYEYAWFGKFQVDEQEWQKTFQLFHEVKSKL